LSVIDQFILSTNRSNESEFCTSEESLFALFKTCESAHTLWKQVADHRQKESLAPLRFRLMPSPKEGSFAWCDPERGQIFVCKAFHREKLLHRLLLELCNMAQADEILKLDDQVGSGMIQSFSIYSKNLEVVEFRSCQMHDQIIDDSTKEPDCQWGTGIISLKYNWTSLDQYLEVQALKHKDKYLKRFKDLNQHLQLTDDEIDIPHLKPKKSFKKAFVVTMGIGIGMVIIKNLLTHMKKSSS